jgi:hypothetical protein
MAIASQAGQALENSFRDWTEVWVLPWWQAKYQSRICMDQCMGGIQHLAKGQCLLRAFIQLHRMESIGAILQIYWDLIHRMQGGNLHTKLSNMAGRNHTRQIQAGPHLILQGPLTVLSVLVLISLCNSINLIIPCRDQIVSQTMSLLFHGQDQTMSALDTHITMYKGSNSVIHP